MEKNLLAPAHVHGLHNRLQGAAFAQLPVACGTKGMVIDP